MNLLSVLVVLAASAADPDMPTVRVEVTGVLVVAPGGGGDKAKFGPVFKIKGLDHYAFIVPPGLREKAKKLAGKRVVLEGFSPFAAQQVPMGIGLGKPPAVAPFEPVVIALAVTGVREAGVK
jgi:hypothetical protein